MAPTNLASKLEFMVVFGAYLAASFCRRSPLGNGWPAPPMWAEPLSIRGPAVEGLAREGN
jgi:hypothetical protein